MAAARGNLTKCLRKTPDSAVLQIWDDILKKSWKEVGKYLLSQSDQMQFLCQASPFAGEACIPNHIRKKSYEKAERVRFDPKALKQAPDGPNNLQKINLSFFAIKRLKIEEQYF